MVKGHVQVIQPYSYSTVQKAQTFAAEVSSIKTHTVFKRRKTPDLIHSTTVGEKGHKQAII